MIRLTMILLMLISPNFNLLSEEVECGGSGDSTKVIYINGMNWQPWEAEKNINEYIRYAVDPNQIDPKGKVVYTLSYNKAESQDWDFLESLVLALKNKGWEEKRLSESILKWRLGNLVQQEYDESIQEAIKLIEDVIETDPILTKSYEDYLVEKKAWFYNLLEEDTQELVNKVYNALNAGDRVLTIGDSQGTLYLNELYRRLERGDVDPNLVGPQNFDFESHRAFLAFVFIGPAVKPINPLSRTVLNNNDILEWANLFSREENEAEITFFEDLTNIDASIEKRTAEEVERNHQLTQTYLNTRNVPHPALQNLRQFTIDSIHEAAALLRLPCIYCVSEDFPSGQLGKSTPQFGFVADTATVTGNVLLRDGVEICGESVIEVLDENLLIMDRSTLWDVKMSVSGIGEYTGEGYIADSKLSNLEIRDTSTAARFSSNSSVVNGGVIVNDGTNLNTDGRAEIYQSTLIDVNVSNSQIWRSTLSNLSIEKSVIDSIFIDAGSGVNASYIYDSYVVNSHVANSRIERSSIVNSDIIENSMITDSGITGNTTRTLIRGSYVNNSGVTDSTLINTGVSYSSVTGSSLSGSFVSDCSVNGVNSSGYNCNSGEVYPW